MVCLTLIFAFIIQVLIASAVLHLAAYVTGHGNRGFPTAIACTLILYVTGFLLGVGMAFLSCMGPCILGLGLIAGFLVTIYVIQSMYETSWWYAFLMFIVMFIVSIIMSLLFHGSEISSRLSEVGIGMISLL